MAKRQGTDKALEAFLRKLRDWDGDDPSFQELVTEAVAQAGVIRKRNNDDTAFVDDIAKQMNVTKAFVQGWVTGKTPANKKLAKTYIKEILIYLEKRRLPAGERSN